MRMIDLRFSLALLLPLLAIFNLWFTPQHAFLSTLAIWLLIAGLDALLPFQSPEPVDVRTSQTWFLGLLRLYVPLQLFLIGLGAWQAMQSEWLVVLGISFAVGFITGAQGITFAHELGHRQSNFDRLMAWVLMTSVNYGHFMVEHYKGHHARAATYDDPATARYGESLYRFLPRTLSGSFINGWRLEAQRIAHTKSAWHKSPLLWSTLVAVGSLLTPFLMLVPALGGMEYTPFAVKITVFLLLQSAIACLMLETINYIEHYGLQRQSAGGKREPFGMNHAWNADCFVTNSLLANLQRHSSHHMHAWKPYSTLQAMPNGPQLPTGYAGCLLIAPIPRLWFALMHPRLKALHPD